MPKYYRILDAAVTPIVISHRKRELNLEEFNRFRTSVAMVLKHQHRKQWWTIDYDEDYGGAFVKLSSTEEKETTVLDSIWIAIPNLLFILDAALAEGFQIEANTIPYTYDTTNDRGSGFLTIEEQGCSITVHNVYNVFSSGNFVMYCETATSKDIDSFRDENFFSTTVEDRREIIAWPPIKSTKKS